MKCVGVENDDIKYLISKKYEKDGFVIIDDLFILGLDGCKQSEVTIVICCDELIKSEEANQLVKYYAKYEKTYKVSAKTFNRICSKENCAGLLILTKINKSEKFLTKKEPIILVCDGLEISGNIGTIFRTAEATNIDGIIFTNQKAKILDDKVVRASRGMIFNVPFCIIENIKELNEILDNYNFRKIICEPEQGVDFKKFNYKGAIAIIVGSERYGVSKSWFECNNIEFIKINMFGKMDSLNVGVATSIVLYEGIYNRKL